MCQGWDLTHDLREDQSDVFVGTIMAEESQQLLRHLLESSIPKNTMTVGDDANRENFYKIRDAYNACLDESEMKKVGSIPLLDILLKIEELFPAPRPSQIGELFTVMNQNHQGGIMHEAENELSATIAYLMHIGVDPLLSFDVRVQLHAITWLSPNS